MKTPVACGEEESTIDSTSWPTNRLSYIELSPQGKATIDKLFDGRSDTPLLMKWVMLHKSGSKFRPRLFVISALRLWILKQHKVFGKSLVLRREYQLMHVQKLTALRSRSPSAANSSTSSTISIRIVVLPKQVDGYCEEPVMLHFDPGTHSESFVRLLQQLLHALRLTFSQQQPPPMKLPPDCHWHEFFPDEGENQDEERQVARSTASTQQNPFFTAMTMAYRAFCDDLGFASVTAYQFDLRNVLLRLDVWISSIVLAFRVELTATSSMNTLKQRYKPSLGLLLSRASLPPLSPWQVSSQKRSKL